MPGHRFVPRLLVAVAAFLAFLPALQADFVNWDDDKYLLVHEAWRGLSPGHLKWMFTAFHYGGYYPVAWLSFGLDYTLFEMDPFGYHLTNLVLHATTAVLLYVLLVELVKNRWAAVAGALLFAVHPLRVETVAWVVERRGILAGLFVIVTVLLYVRAHRPGEEPRWGLVALAVATYALSLLSKGFALTLPFVLLLLDGWPLRRFGRESTEKILLEKLPFVLVAAAIGLLARAAQESGAAIRSFVEHPLLDRVAQSAYGLVFYVQKTLLPAGLSPLHPLEQRLDWAEPRFLLAAVIVVAVTLGAWRLRRRAPAVLVAWLAYALLIAPVLGLMQSGPQLVGERYSYIATLPFAPLVAAGLARVAGRPAVIAACLVVAVALGVLSFAQTRVWRDSVTLWTAAIERYPDGIQARFNLGNALAAAGRDKDAISHYERCVAIYPKHARAWTNLGLGYLRLRNLEKSASASRRAAELRPNDAEPLYTQALAVHGLERFGEVIRLCERALRRDETYVHALPLMADALKRKGRVREAREAVERALELDPGYEPAQRLRRELRR